MPDHHLLKFTTARAVEVGEKHHGPGPGSGRLCDVGGAALEGRRCQELRHVPAHAFARSATGERPLGYGVNAPEAAT
jgi:hypothetical protein